MVGTDEDAHGGESDRLPRVAVLGVDGWRGAWVGALLDGRSVDAAARCPTSPPCSPSRTSRWSAIDMPIGLSDDGVRACDVEARRRLRRGRGELGVPRAGAPGAGGATTYAEARPAVAWPRRGGRCRRRPSSWCRRSGRSTTRSATRPTAPGARGPPRAGLPRARRRRARPQGAPPAGTVQRIRALRAVMDVLDALADAPRRRARGRRARRVRRGLVGAAASPTGAAECVGDGADGRPRPADADLLVNTRAGRRWATGFSCAGTPSWTSTAGWSSARAPAWSSTPAPTSARPPS